ncbi:MAG: phosphatase PAP2 family protein [Candidatus Hodarchaeota archaeon]
MSEKNEYLSKRALMIIGITAVVTLIIGLILYYTGFNEAFYSTSSTVRSIFKAISYLGEPIVFLILVVLLYLAYNKKYAKNLLLTLLFSHYINEVLKAIFRDPRPAPNIDPAEDYGVIEASYGFPSGHSQNAVAFWGYLGKEFKDKYKSKQIPIIPVILSVVIFLIAISRIIIGVHDLQDIIGGLLIGMGVLLAFIYLEPTLSNLYNKISFVGKIIIIVIISLVLFLVGTFLYPYAGTELALTPVPIYPDSGAFGVVGGVTLGFGLGYTLEHQYVKYDPSQLSTKKKILNIIIGLVIALLVFIPLEYLLEINSVFYRFARYAIIAFILSFVVPLICTKINK